MYQRSSGEGWARRHSEAGYPVPEDARIARGPKYEFRRVGPPGTVLKSKQMDRDRVRATLREHEAELRSIGIQHLSLFGSKARGDDTAESDVDLMAEFEKGRRFSLLDMVSMENRLADILRLPVDLAPAASLKEGIRERAIREAVPAF